MSSGECLRLWACLSARPTSASLRSSTGPCLAFHRNPGTTRPKGITCDVTLWAACIGGAMQVGDYTSAIEAAGLRVTQVRDNPQYQFISKNAQGATRKYGVKSVSLVATRD